ncbi:BTAD domain-containing putative transcriptional regulator [Microbacterium sp. MPKO10]|uniref:BTAD domain-containing putative transcriptional regulator n=1 Tax=Microbacterium sp. MPKO10 TaxID=2989818 RepID=UPI002236345C|nr:BTAD domain-containing putative transcriptional regulator [Microbacterium sp. MPKO10]MCW4457858.1 AAA family ATPase [Microbacterium sp. MPKO10]
MTERGDSTDDPMRVRVLGPVLVDDASVTGLLPRRLIAALALARPHPLSTDALADAVWGDDLPENVRASLQTLVSRTRAVLGSDAIERSAAGYRLTVTSDLDAARTMAQGEDAVNAPARGGSDSQVGEAWRDDLWHGDAAADLGEAPVATELRSESDRLHGAFLRQRARQLADGQQWAEAVTAYQHLVATNPIDEPAAVGLMTALENAGRRTEALAAFARLRESLADALGTDPGTEAVALNTRLLRGEARTEQRQQQVGVRTRRSPLIGRDGDIDEVEHSIATHRLTTILGVGGLGKTSLAQEVARRSTAPVTVVVELAGATSPDDVLITVTTTLGIRTISSVARMSDPMVRTDVRSRVIAALADNETLLILDNCEHLVDAAADLADDLLSAVPSLRILATSRSPLAIEGEQVVALPALALTEGGAPGPAVALFLQRARAVRPGADLPLDAVSRICASLDGLPLAIELAAARVRSLSLTDIERRLRDRFALLTTVDRSAPARHRTLFAVIDWSWKLLEPRQRQTLRRLSLFVDGFTADAAAHMAANGTDIVDDLDALVMQSLVQVHEDADTVRYRLLETVREFARERLDEAAESATIEERYEQWITGLALDLFDRLLGPGQLDALAVAISERENLVAALRHAIARAHSDVVYTLFGLLSLFWSIRGEHEEFLAFGSDVLSATEKRPTSPHIANVAVHGLALLAATFTLVGARRVAYLAISRIRHLVRTGTVTDSRALVLAELLSLPSANTDDGMESMFAWFDAQLRSADDARAAYAGSLGANGAENFGEFERAVAYGRAAYSRAIALGDTWLQSAAASTVAQLLSQNGRASEVIPWAHRAADTLAQIDADGDRAQARWMLSLTQLQLGDPSVARSMLDELNDDAPGELRGLLLTLDAELAVHEERYSDAVASLDDAQALLETTGGRSAPWLVLAMATRALTRQRAGAPRESIIADGDRLSARIRALIRLRGWSTDQPVVGSGVAAIGAIALDDAESAAIGVELILLAERMGYRRDFAVLAERTLLDRAEATCGADAVAEARARAASHTPIGRLDRIVTLLDNLAATRSAVTDRSGAPSRHRP